MSVAIAGPATERRIESCVSEDAPALWCGLPSLPEAPPTDTKITDPPNTIQRAGSRKKLLSNAIRGAVQNLAVHHDCRGTRRDPHDQVAARCPRDQAIRPVADKSDDKKRDAVPDTQQAAGNMPAANNTAAAEGGTSPVPEVVHKPADS